MAITTRLLDQLEAGQQLGQYILLEPIGRGGQATIWSGWDNVGEQLVAIKVIYETPGEDLTSRETFEREARIIASLDHPGILPLYEFRALKGHRYLVTRYISSGSLKELLDNGPLQIPEMLRITRQIIAVLDYTHSRGVVHRDLKSGNILLDTQNRVYLTDFGLARDISGLSVQLHTGHGTAPYAPPEQHTMAAITPRSDIYSLGILIYEMLTGELPWKGAVTLALQQIQDTAALLSPPGAGPTLPASLATVLNRLTAPQPEQRPSTVIRAFDLLLDSLRESGNAHLIELAALPPDLTDTSHYAPQWQASAEDSLSLIEQGIQNWDRAGTFFDLSYTHYMFIDSSYSRAEELGIPVSAAQVAYLLRGALQYDHHALHWWRRLEDPTARVDLCTRILESRDMPLIERALMVIAGDSSLIQCQQAPQLFDRLVNLIVEPDTPDRVRGLAFDLIEQSAPHPRRWQETAFGEDVDARLAELALEDSALSRHAARLIGQTRSIAAVNSLLAAEKSTGRQRVSNALGLIRRAAGTLPGSVPVSTRLGLAFDTLRTRAFQDRTMITWLRLGLGIACALVVVLFMALGWFASWDIQMRDALFLPYQPSGIVTLIAIDDQALEYYGRWDAWPRSLHADLIDALAAAGTRSILLDITFASDTLDDELLAESIRQAGAVVLPVLGQGDAYTEDGYVRYSGGVLPGAAFHEAAAALGQPNILHSTVDGYVRSVPLLAEIDGTMYPSIALAAIEQYLGLETSPMTTGEGRRLQAAGRMIPVGPAGEMLIHYAGPPAAEDRETFRTFSYLDLMEGRVPAEALADKIVLIGITATAEPDRYLTPVSRGRPMYGVEILANVIETIWGSRFITLPPIWVEMLVVLVLGALTGLLATRPWLGLLLTLLEISGYFIITTLFIDSMGVILSLLYPFMAIGLSYVAVTAYRFSVEYRQRSRIMRLLESRVTPEVAKSTLQAIQRGDLELGGQMQDVTAVVLALRGLDAFAEAHATEEVIAAINTYMDIATDAIFALNGTIASRERGQIVAIFNAPLKQPDHAWLAAKAAVEAKDRVRDYHSGIAESHPHRKMAYACGVYTGRAIVGYAGSTGRLEYSALGEAVNIGVQIAQMAYPEEVLIGDLTYQAISDRVGVIPQPSIMVKGRLSPIPIFVIDRILEGASIN
nr:CHASE2 domain-containing protein [Anaerolineae bacterium]